MTEYFLKIKFLYFSQFISPLYRIVEKTRNLKKGKQKEGEIPPSYEYPFCPFFFNNPDRCSHVLSAERNRAPRLRLWNLPQDIE